MSSATISIPDELQPELDELARERNVTPTEVLEAAVRNFLLESQKERKADADEDFKPFWVPVLEEKDEFGEPDVSINHDYYLAEDLYQRKFSERKLSDR
jgi:hypothetical protein